MKKLIALILILVITSFVVVSNDDQPLGIKIAIQNSNNPNPKNRNWEYVKDRLFDGETEKVFKRDLPILISLDNASKQDSLIVNEIIKGLRTVIPNITIGCFDNFTGVSLETALRNDYNKKYKGIPLYDLMKSTTSLNFIKISNINIVVESQLGRNYVLPYEIGNISRTHSGTFFDKSISPFYINFRINKEISFEERKTYIQYELLRSLCYISENKFINENEIVNSIYKSANHNPEHSKFTEEDKFLLQKLYSDGFIDQFKDYMYANYPWRYASSFINKKMHEFKVWGIIIGVSGLVFILIFSYFQDRNYKYSYLNYLFPIFLILLHFINLTNIYQYLTKFNSVIGWKSHILFQIPLAIVLSVLISFVLWGLEKISLKGNENFSYQLVLKVCYTFITFILPMVIIAILNWGQKGMLESLFPYVFFVLGLAIGRGLLLYLNHFSESLVKEKEVELSRLKEAKAEAEVKMLQSQINPHFLYNALNSIASLAHTDADKTEKMALSLSDLFRHSINRKGKKVNTLGDELSLVRNYLEIEQIRFGDRLDFSIDVEPDLLKVEIPMFMLQPLVENAIKHGISKIEDQGEIVLKVNKKDNGILISVQDNGPDFPEGLVSGHGLQTVYDLLRFSYGDKSEISWHNHPKKEITIFIDTVFK
jgi:two-component system LytT family sensor kinase